MMKKDTKNKFITNLMEDLNKASKYLSEVYDFDDDMGGEPMAEPGMEQGPDPQMVQQPQQQAPGEMQSEEEAAMRAQEIIQHEPIVAKIRETAIEGLKKYADHPTSDLYTYFKSVFLDSDKLLTKSGGK